ncbi:MAG: polysaccharide biosynthesis/export family protein [Acidobacteriota bacterium]|nr:MAG: polysaccharide biosynthesis/export family protein [Acidobacteriota bacterium]
MEEDYRIGPGDVVEILVDGAPELSGQFRVSVGGKISMHYLGTIAAGKMTPNELARFIADGLRERYIYDPHVTVAVKQVNSRSYFIQGAVNSAGVFQIEGQPTLLELITLAGGLAQNHGSTAFIIRKNKQALNLETRIENPKLDTPEEKAERAASMFTLVKANINGLLKGNFDQNMFLEPGDIVNIPQTDVFFVAGEVKAPGSFPLKEGTTLRQAITLAQGINFTGNPGRGLIFRENPATGQREEIAVDINAVMNGKSDDQVLRPNDMVLVPNNRMKKIAGPLLNGLALNMLLLPIRF